MATFLSKQNALEQRGDLDKRVAWAVGKYAVYILGGGKDADPNVVQLKVWAKKVLPGTNNVDVANLMKTAVVNDPNYTNNNAVGDTDAADSVLNAIVETLVNTVFLNY